MEPKSAVKILGAYFILTGLEAVCCIIGLLSVSLNQINNISWIFSKGQILVFILLFLVSITSILGVYILLQRNPLIEEKTEKIFAHKVLMGIAVLISFSVFVICIALYSLRPIYLRELPYLAYILQLRPFILWIGLANIQITIGILIFQFLKTGWQNTLNIKILTRILISALIVGLVIWLSFEIISQDGNLISRGILPRIINHQGPEENAYLKDYERLSNLVSISQEIVITHLEYKKYFAIDLSKVSSLDMLFRSWAAMEDMESFYQMTVYEVKYEVQMNTRNQTGKALSTTYLLIPDNMDAVDINKGLFMYFTGTIKQMDMFRPGKVYKSSEPQSIDNFAPYYLSVYFRVPTVIVPKDIDFKCNCPDFDPIGQQYILSASAKQAGLKVLEEMGYTVPKKHVYVSGLSRGGYRALLLSAFDPDIAALYDISGWFSYRDYVDKNLNPVGSDDYVRVDLLEQGIEFSDFLSLIRAKTKLAFSMEDTFISPSFISLIRNANLKRNQYGLDPIEVEIFHLEPNQEGHSWPRVEALEFFTNFIVQGH